MAVSASRPSRRVTRNQFSPCSMEAATKGLCTMASASVGGTGGGARREPLPLVALRREEGAKPRLILFLAQVIDQVASMVADENRVLLDGLDERLHPARRRFDPQAGGLGRQNHPDLSFLHIMKQAGKRLAALAELLSIGEISELAVVLCRIDRGLAAVVHLL